VKRTISYRPGCVSVLTRTLPRHMGRPSQKPVWRESTTSLIPLEFVTYFNSSELPIFSDKNPDIATERPRKQRRRSGGSWSRALKPSNKIRKKSMQKRAPALPAQSLKAEVPRRVIEFLADSWKPTLSSALLFSVDIGLGNIHHPAGLPLLLGVDAHFIARVPSLIGQGDVFIRNGKRNEQFLSRGID